MVLILILLVIFYLLIKDNIVGGYVKHNVNFFEPNCNKNLMTAESSIEMVKHFEEGDLLFECNECIGADTMVIQSKYKKVIVCEINPEYAEILKHNVDVMNLSNKITIFNDSCLNVLKNDYPITHLFFDPVWVDKDRNLIIERHLTVDNIPVDTIITDLFDRFPTLKEVYVKYPNKNNCKFENGTIAIIPLILPSGIKYKYKLHIIKRFDSSKTHPASINAKTIYKGSNKDW